MYEIEDRVALITGASTGIGRASAQLLAAHGARVVVSARDAEALERLVAVIEAEGGEALAVPGDLREPGVAAGLVARAVEHFGGLDIAVNNAATMGPLGPFDAVDTQGWHDTLAINLTSAFFGAQAQARAMRERGGGAIVFVASFVGYTAGLAGMSAYAATKGGLLGLTRTLAAELAPEGIRVNALCPGGTDTPVGRSVASTPEARAQVAAMHALGRLAEPDEIARSVLYLVSDASSFTTGTALLADGGVSIHRH